MSLFFNYLKSIYKNSAINILTKIHVLKKAGKMTPKELEALRKKRLQKLLKHVLKNSRFYQNHYRHHGITLRDVPDLSLEDLPTIDKQIMMEHFDDLVCSPDLKKTEIAGFLKKPYSRGKKYRHLYQVMHTSGSTGEPAIFIYGPDDWARLKAMVISRVTKTPINPFKKAKLAYFGVTNGNYAGISLTGDAPKSLFRLLLIHINTPTQKTVQQLNQYQPEYLSGYASGLQLLAHEQLAGRLKIKPKSIICSADPLTPLAHNQINEAFGIEPTNFYAASESLGMAVQCEAHEGLHLFSDWHYFELVDEKQNPVNQGEPGKLILTNLYNFTQPLIRYQMNDEFSLSTKPCACDEPFPIMQTFSGRVEEFLWFNKADGSRESLHPFVFIELLLRLSTVLPSLEKLQVVQERPNHLLCKVVFPSHNPESLVMIESGIFEILKKKNLEDMVSFNVKPVDDIPNDAISGKFKTVIPFKGK